jgi:SNF2 family DNA or RNA helicase
MTIIATTYQTSKRRLVTEYKRPFWFRPEISEEERENILAIHRKRNGKSHNSCPLFRTTLIDLDKVYFPYEPENLNALDKPKPQNGPIDGYVISYQIKSGMLPDGFEFSRVICDEAHVLKKKDGALYSSVMQLPTRAYHLLTGSPMNHSVKDLGNILRLVWTQLGLGD